jgi:hypothetical protein
MKRLDPNLSISLLAVLISAGSLGVAAYGCRQSGQSLDFSREVHEHSQRIQWIATFPDSTTLELTSANPRAMVDYVGLIVPGDVYLFHLIEARPPVRHVDVHEVQAGVKRYLEGHLSRPDGTIRIPFTIPVVLHTHYYVEGVENESYDLYLLAVSWLATADGKILSLSLETLAYRAHLDDQPWPDKFDGLWTCMNESQPAPDCIERWLEDYRQPSA